MRAALARSAALPLLALLLLVAQRLAPAAPVAAGLPPAPDPAPGPLPPPRALAVRGPPGMDGLASALDLAGERWEVSREAVAAALARSRLSPDASPLAPQEGYFRPLVVNGHGDFHHLSYFVLRDAVEPLGLPYTVISFDAHDDAHATAGGIDCGSWGRWALERLPRLSRMVVAGLTGPLAGDSAAWFDHPGFAAGRLDLLAADELSLFFARPPPPGLLAAAVRRDLGSTLGGRPGWEVRLASLTEWASRLAERAPTPYVYLSVDADVLAPEDFVDVGWGEGGLRLQALVEAIGAIAARRQVLGADVCGYPPARRDEVPGPYDERRALEAYRAVVAALRAALEAPPPAEARR